MTEQYNCAIMTLRKYKAHTMTESSVLNAVVRLNETKTDLSRFGINCFI